MNTCVIPYNQRTSVAGYDVRNGEDNFKSTFISVVGTVLLDATGSFINVLNRTLDKNYVTTSGLSCIQALPSKGRDVVYGAADELEELKSISGLTWDQIARILNVTRRSIHFWIKGGVIAAGNQERLSRLLLTLRSIAFNSPSETRSFLLHPTEDGVLPLDNLRYGLDEEVISLYHARSQPTVSYQSTRHHRNMDSLVSPDILLTALQDSIHVDVGKARPVKAKRISEAI